MVRLELARRLCVVHWRRNSLFVCLTGMYRDTLLTAYSSSVRYPHSRLLEINSHSLFSRWFSESGKLVQRLFSTVTDMVEDEDTFVVVLIGIVSPLVR